MIFRPIIWTPIFCNFFLALSMSSPLEMLKEGEPSFARHEFPVFGNVFSVGSNPHFSQAFYCGVAYRHVYGVALGRAPRHTVKYACGALCRAPCIHACLHRLAMKSCEKCGLMVHQQPVRKRWRCLFYGAGIDANISIASIKVVFNALKG